MDELTLPIIALHVIAVVAWIGGLAAVAIVATSKLGDEKLRGAMARKLYQWLAASGFGVAFVLGLIRLLSGWKSTTIDANGIVAAGYSKAPWMHVKLTLALVVIALHHVIGARVRKMQREGATAGPIGTLAVIALLCAAGAIFMVILRPFHG